MVVLRSLHYTTPRRTKSKLSEVSQRHINYSMERAFTVRVWALKVDKRLVGVKHIYTIDILSLIGLGVDDPLSW
tara:strand:- start:159482 stop:159703 length:222 start_codon:yes stop_codon:yes gene_type:complete